MTRLQLRGLIRKRLGETTAAFWTDPELNNWINDAGHEVAFDSKCIKVNDYMTTTSEQEYTLSDTFPYYLSILEVYLYMNGEKWWKLEKTTTQRLNNETPGWKSADSSVPQQYYWSKQEDVLGVYPKPNSDNQGEDYLQVYYTQDYTELSEDSEEPNIPVPLQLAMADFVVATGYETRGWGDKANDAWQKYSSRVKAYLIEVDREHQEDEESLVMKNYRNLR